MAKIISLEDQIYQRVWDVALGKFSKDDLAVKQLDVWKAENPKEYTAAYARWADCIDDLGING